MSPFDSRTPGPERPLGLRFLVDALNSKDLHGEWPQLTASHRGHELAALATEPAGLAATAAALRAIFDTSTTEHAMTLLNALLAQHTRHAELTIVANERIALRPALTAAASAHDALLTVGAFALATWLAERGRCAWGICAAASCERVFIDEGRRAPQRFCSTPCATRTRVAEHRRAARDGGPSTGPRPE